MEIDDLDSDVSFYLDWALETGIWDGRQVSWIEASDFADAVAKRILELLTENPENPILAQFACIGTPAANQSLLAREIRELDFSRDDLILQAGLKKSLSKFWKKHKKEILIGAAIVAIITVVVVVAVCTGGTGAAAAGAAGSAALGACEGEKKEKPAKSEPKVEPQPPVELSINRNELLFQESGVVFDGQYTRYTDILLNRVEYHPPEIASSPEIQPPTFLDVQTHYETPTFWNNPYSTDFLDSLGAQPNGPKEETFSITDLIPQAGTQQTPVCKEKPWSANFLDALVQGFREGPEMLEPHTFLPNHQFSTIVFTEGIRDPRKGLGLGNGMNTTLEEAVGHANHLAQFAQGHSVDLMYNNSHGPLIDMLEILTLNLRGCSPNTADLHRQVWDNFHKYNLDRPQAKYLQFGHSQDSVHIFNALKKAPKEIQQRVIVILFGPAVVIPKGLCFKIVYYACEGDVAPYAEILDAGITGGFLKGLPVALRHDDIIWVPRHPNTKNPHDFRDPAFNEIKKEHIEDYLKRNGEYLDQEGDSNESKTMTFEELNKLA